MQAKSSRASTDNKAQADKLSTRPKPTDLSIEERRKLTYAAPQLTEGRHPIQKQPSKAAQAASLPELSNLTKAQRKNWRRSQKRKEDLKK